MAIQDKSIPKYFQISQDLIARIKSGHLAAGVQVPSENEIIESYNVMRSSASRRQFA